ncbi:unnamed protein product [Citrullus colocynthis]|uniref:Uncharacterized protein n=1 Tax=Citrullus colocynthis TaxID=252529 RepID=A0ABP0YFM2_9ROSI
MALSLTSVDVLACARRGACLTCVNMLACACRGTFSPSFASGTVSTYILIVGLRHSPPLNLIIDLDDILLPQEHQLGTMLVRPFPCGLLAPYSRTWPEPSHQDTRLHLGTLALGSSRLASTFLSLWIAEKLSSFRSHPSISYGMAWGNACSGLLEHFTEQATHPLKLLSFGVALFGHNVHSQDSYLP